MVGKFQTPLSSFDSNTNTNSIETSSSPPLVKWRSDDFKTKFRHSSLLLRGWLRANFTITWAK